MVYLEVRIRNQEPRRYPMGSTPLTIGCGSQCDIHVISDNIAEVHAVVHRRIVASDPAEEGRIVFQGRRVNREIISPGEQFELDSDGAIVVRVCPGAIQDSLASEGKSRDDSGKSNVHLEELRERVRELENEKGELTELLQRRDAELGRYEGQLAQRTAEARAQALTDTLQLLLGRPMRPELREASGGAFDQVELIAKAFLSFFQRVEESIVRLAGSEKPRRRHLQSVLATLPEKVPDAAVKDLNNFLGRIGENWAKAILLAYRRGVSKWALAHLQRMSPVQIRKDCGGPSGIGAKGKLWDHYSASIERFTAQVIVDEIDEAVESVAIEFKQLRS